ncbi:MAG TPA: phosphotransferase, partial [Pseudomonadales bacterium]|nr:phosphotransferase [Pseudomonadales bacterium]
YWDTLPATLLHGDTHLGNTFSYPDGRAGFFDWQVIYRGNGLRDVAYFVLLSLDNDTRKQYERELIEHYFDQLEARGVSLNRELSWLHYCLFSLDALDANIKTQTRGGYGHANSAQQRAYRAIVGGMQDNGVADLLKQVVKNGKL